MEQKNNVSSANDAVMNVKIHDNTLLGRMNEEGKYVLPTAVVEELIQAKKYLEQKVEDTIYLSCHLTSVEKNLTMMMNYSLIGNGDKIMVNWALVEQVSIADGMITNQLITSICSNVYDYSEDVLLRAFADFNVYIKDEDSGEERKLYNNEKTALTDVIVKYNIAVQTITDKKIKKLCNKTCAKQLDYLKKKDTNYTKAVMQEIEKGMEVYVTLQTLEGNDIDDIEDKAMLDIINNAVEKVDLTMDLESEEDIESQKEFHDFRSEVFTEFREDTRALEEEAQDKIVRSATDDTKPEILGMLDVIKEAETSDVSDTINLREFLSPKAGQTLEQMEQHTKHKMAHITDKLSEQESDNKYSKIQDFLLNKEDEKSKAMKEKKVKLDASLNALLGKGQKTTEATEIKEQKSKVELENTAGTGEVQVSGAKKAEKKPELKKEEKTTKKETKPTKPKKKATATATQDKPKKAEKPEVEEKKEATLTGERVAVLAPSVSENSPKQEDTPTPKETKEVKQEEQKREDAGSALDMLDKLLTKEIQKKPERNIVEELNNAANAQEDNIEELGM